MTAKYLKLGEIQIGEPDSNSEYFSALRGKREPLFLNAFLLTPHLPIDQFLTGEKYLIHGQKGTGKTATLRYIENKLKENSTSEYLIFKKAFIEEVDLQSYSKLPLLVDEEEIKKFKHYHHALKRVFIYLIISLYFKNNNITDHNSDPKLSETNKKMLDRVRDSTVGDVIKFAFDSLKGAFAAASINIEAITDSNLLLNVSKIIKHNNDDLLNFFCRQMKRNQKPIRLFVDEIHFAYRSEESLQQDAILVRDCILSVQSLNERFAEEGVDCIIFASVRSEYLEHPIISTADINHAIESVGVNINWSNYQLNKSHPLFDMLYNRFRTAMKGELTKEEFINVYFSNIDLNTFLSRTWNKPRDFIRFFKCAKEMFPNRINLTDTESNTVWRRYAQDAWSEIKSSASPFLSPESLSLLEMVLRNNAPDWFANKKITVVDFANVMRPVYEKAKGENANFYSFDHFLHLLYILGLFGTKHESGQYEIIYQTYHRGNRSFHASGQVQVHPTVMKAFG